MSLLALFEGLAERLFTGPFKKNSARLQPVEIAKELIKAMLRHKQVSISQVYVPNVYRVFLHPDDWGPLASFGNAFLVELSKYLALEGERYGYTFLTKPSVELHADQTVQLRELFIEVDFDDSIDVLWEDDGEEMEEKSYWGENTNIFQNQLRTNFTAEAEDSRISEYFLEVIEGIDAGKTYPIGESMLCIGRHTKCEIVLEDPEISRRHVNITPNGQGWLVDDLGSTNGTMVNNQRITRETVAPGDRIQLGQTVLVIRRRNT